MGRERERERSFVDNCSVKANNFLIMSISATSMLYNGNVRHLFRGALIKFTPVIII